jgi:hypothetical protein
MNTVILVVIMVFNGNPYVEVPKYAAPYPDMADCQKKADTFPKRGFTFNKAVCVPQVSPLAVPSEFSHD